MRRDPSRSGMWRWLLGLFLLLPAGESGRPACGGTFRAARGILSTPNFPNEFPVPISCEWVIDAQDFQDFPNTSIVVYLTQLFVYEGLTFTEYPEYDKRYANLPGKQVHEVTEKNIFDVRWVQSHQNYLVISLELNVIESTHLRVLDHFLDVYGFNITYEISRGAARDDACTMMDCGFTGNCYDHYTKFSCDCLPGFSGPNCSGGPRSPCTTTGNAECKNGATCINAGTEAFICTCAEGYTGSTCEIQEESPANKECDNCLVACPFDGKPENVCRCPRDKSDTLLKDRTAFSARLHLSNLPKLNNTSLQLFIENQIQQTMRPNYTKSENLNVYSIQRSKPGVLLVVHFYGPKKDEKKVKSVLRKWAARGYIGNLTISDREVTFGNSALMSVSHNSRGETIREGDEITLSCEARGPQSMSFRWFKDGIFVNANLTENSPKWVKLHPGAGDQYTYLLTISRTDKIDQGVFTCQLEDSGIQQCRSVKVVIRERPFVKIEPMSLTVQKEENFTIKCNSMSGSSQNKYTYFWMKDGKMLRIRSKFEKYEILYPEGSILQVYKIEKSVNYTCVVQDRDLSNEASIRINVIDRDTVQTCAGEEHLNVWWPETAPDTESVQGCPRGYGGAARRLCSLVEVGKCEWMVPDFSGCINSTLQRNVVSKFQMLQMAYEQTSSTQTLVGYLAHLNGGAALLPGEGARILTSVLDVIGFINDLKDADERDNPAELIFGIIDRVAVQKWAVMNEMQVKLLQITAKETARLVSRRFIKAQSVLHQSFTTIDVSMAPVDKSGTSIHVPLPGNSYPYWMGYQLNCNFAALDKPKLPTGGVLVFNVVYRNLTSFLPIRSVIRLKDGSSIEYEIASRVASVWVISAGADVHRGLSLSMEFSHDAKNASLDSWNLICGAAELAGYGYGWDPHICQTERLNDTGTRCLCPASGTFAVLLTARPSAVETEEDKRYEFILLTGCVFCFLFCLITGIILLVYWIIRRTCLVFLQLQCSFSVAGAMLVIAIGILGKPSEVSNMYIMTFLEAFLLIGLSSQLSKLLIVYTEIVELPRPASTKQTVIGIITGVPVITVFGTHLAHRTMNIKLNSWWLRPGTLSFNIFVTCSSVIFILFLFLYVTVMRKLMLFIKLHTKHSKALQKRADILQRSPYIFFLLILVTASSIFYINSSKTLFWHCEFSIASVVLGFYVNYAYVLSPEASPSLRRLKLNKDDNYFSSDSASSPLKFFTKQEAEVESEGAPQRKRQNLGNGTKKAECHLLAESPYQEANPIFGSQCTSFTEKPPLHDNERSKSLESYSSSPKHFHHSQQSPDILSTKVFVELDLVASSMKAAQMPEPTKLGYPPPRITITPDEAIAKILDDPSTKGDAVERQQPEGREKILIKEPGAVEEPCIPSQGVDKLDGMLDSISQDLDYLLNRTSDVEVVPVVPAAACVGYRKISKPPAPSVIEEIQEENEDDAKVPEAITDVLRTSC